MRDGIRQVNNPERVPDTLTAIDGPQEGARRVIHPVAMVVGTDPKEHEMYQRAEPEFFEVPADGTYRDRRGNPIAFKKGDRIPLSRAAQIEAFNVDLSGRHVSGITPARKEAAPENRMEPAPETPEGGEGDPENREGYETIKAREEAERNAQQDEENLTPQQKAARTRAANQAAREEAEADADQSDDADSSDESGE